MKAIIYKTFFLWIFLGLFTYLNISAQQAPPKKIWDKTFGGDGDDNLPSMLSTNDGGFLLGGNSSSYKSENNKGDFDYWIVKIDANGNKLWDKTFGGDSLEVLNSMVNTLDGGFLLGGWSKSNQNNDKSENSKGAEDYWLIKIDANGNKVWDKTFGGDNSDLLNSMISTSDGGFLLGGYSYSNKGGDKSENNKGSEGTDYWVIKIDMNGNKLWDKTLGGDISDYLYSIIATSDSGFLLGGTSWSGKSGDKSENNKDIYPVSDYWIIKIDANGNKVWDKTLGGGSIDDLNYMLAISDGGFLLGGRSYSDKSGDKSENNKGLSDFWVVKIDANGNKVWDKTLGGEDKNDFFRSIVTTPDKGFLLGGSNPNFWIVKIDAQGNKIWDKTLGEDIFDYLGSILVTSNGGYLLGGTSLSNKKESNYWVVKLDKEILGSNHLSGTVFQINEADCNQTANKIPLIGWTIQAKSNTDTYYTVSDSLGKYSLYLDKDTYTITQIQPSNEMRKVNIQNCPTQPYSITFDSLGKDTTGFNFGLDVSQCAILKVDVSSSMRRRCFQGQTTITYQNEGIGKAENVQLEVDFPEYILPLKSSLPWTAKKGKTLTFNLGTLQAGEQKRIVITDSVACVEQARNLTQCVEARISPKNSCLAPNPNWNGASLELRGKCFLLTEPIAQIVLKNTGKANMAQASKYRIFANDSLLLASTVQLIAGDSLLLEFPTQGLSIRVEAEQVTLHSEANQLLSVNVEGCSLINNQKPQNQGFVNRFIQADANLETEIDCQIVRDSFDPNDKLVSPEGITEKHYVKPDTRLEYTLRFQNTGNAEAINIQVIDTLSSDLNFESFEMMSASHSYQLEVRGSQKQVLIFKFPNINLPDSTTNKAQSQGFVKFKISPKANLAVGTIVKNFADIYFDYNEPVRTNVTEINYTDYQFPSVKSVKPCEVKGYAPKKPIILQNPNENKLKADISGATYQWFRNGALMSQNTQTIDLNQSGDYEVIVSKNGCISEKSAKFSFVVTALSEFEKQAQISIYPNPSQGNLNLKMANTLTKELKVSVLHSSGKTVWQKSFQTDTQTDWETSLDLNHLPQGLYFLEIENSKGKSVKKIIVER